MKRGLIVVAKAAVIIIGAAATYCAAFLIWTEMLDLRFPSDPAALAVLVGALTIWIWLVVGWRALMVATIRSAFRAADRWRAIWEEAKQR